MESAIVLDVVSLVKSPGSVVSAAVNCFLLTILDTVSSLLNPSFAVPAVLVGFYIYNLNYRTNFKIMRKFCRNRCNITRPCGIRNKSKVSLVILIRK